MLCAVLLQVRKLTGLGQKKAHLIEIQVNGGSSVSDKVDFATKLFEKVSVSSAVTRAAVACRTAHLVGREYGRVGRVLLK
jgi:ribosomal protein L3